MKAIRMLMVAAAALLPNNLFAQGFSRGDPVPATLPLGNERGDPRLDMPTGQRLISAFGERPVFSPRGEKLAFIGKSYGDAFEYDMQSGRIRNITAHAPSEGYLRIHYLNDESYLLLGPRTQGETREETRYGHIEMFWMDGQGARAPVPLGLKVFEGVATSRKSNLIAWSEITVGATPTSASTTVFTGRLVLKNGVPTLNEVEKIVTTSDCLVEAQDFLPDENGLLMPCYYHGKGPTGVQTKVISVDLATKKITEYPTPPTLYGEVEGIFPDGKRALVECAQDRSKGMDICILDLNSAKPRYTRMTNIVRYGGWKYGNPVVRPDARTIAAQVGSANVADAGVGEGIVLMELAPNF